MKTLSPYRTAAELRIKPWEHDGLVALVGPLSRGEIRFDMRTAACETKSCGTVACIGGHLAMLHGMSLANSAKYVHRYRRSEGWPEHGLTALFFPEPSNAWYCTAQQAGAAVVNYLTLGDPRWSDVMRASVR